MQELTAPTQTASPYTPAGGSNMAAAPRLGTPIPGTTASMPAQSGLSVFNTPLAPSLQSTPQQTPQQTAQQMQSYGRGDDSMLIHMTPDEVGGLQNLAMAHGGSLTINPDTGLPEAGWLGKLLPTLLGAALAATGVGAPLAAGIVGLGQTALTGDISKGLMAGLQAFGGGSLAGAAGLGGAISSNAGGILGSNAGIFGANMGAGAATAGAGTLANLSPAMQSAISTPLTTGAAPALTQMPTGMAGQALSASSKLAPVMQGALPMPAAPALAQMPTGLGAKTGIAGFGQKFGQTASAGLGGSAAKYAPYLAGYGVFSGLSDASQPPVAKPEENKSKYEGPYSFPTRRFDPRESGPGGEIQFFDEVNPLGVLTGTGERRYAEGGEAKEEERPSWMQDWMSDYKTPYEKVSTTPEGVDIWRATQGAAQRDASRNADYAVIKKFIELQNVAGEAEAAGNIQQFRGTPEGKEYIDLIKQRQDIADRQRYIHNKDQEFYDKYGTTFTTSAGDKPTFTPPPGGGGGGGGGGITSIPVPNTGNIDPNMGGVTPGTGRDATTSAPGGGLTSTTVGPIGNITPTMGGVTAGTGTGATLSDRVLSSGATQSGAGLEALKDAYTPSFSNAANFTTAAAPPSTMGADLFSALGDLSSRYGASPGAITASSGYAGGSPSERIRETARANAAARAAAAKITPLPGGGTTTPPPGGGTTTPPPGDGAGEVNFGTNAPTPFAGGTFNPFAGGTFNPFAGGTFNPYDGGAVSPGIIQPGGPAADGGSYTPPVGDGTGEVDFNMGMTNPLVAGAFNPYAGMTNPFAGGMINPYAGRTVDPSIVQPGVVDYGSYGNYGDYYGNYGGGYGGEASEAGGGGYGGGGGEYGRQEYVDYKAKGGEVNMDNGAFVVDARTVSEMGNGSSNAGIERLAAMGGRPVRGNGDGVSDSVRARIGGRQEARVARDEVIFSPQVIARLGNGSHSRGTQKLYALMKRAHTARKHAKRGQDTKMAKGLGALA